MLITSTSNIKIKRLLNLRKKSKARAEEELFLIEGIRMFRELPADRLKEVYVSESLYHKEKLLITQIAETAGVKPQLLTDTVFAHVSDTKTPQGILCTVAQNAQSLEKVLNYENPHILILDNLQDPGNVGTIVRTAEGAGVTGIIMSQDCVDIYNPKTIRSTMGSIFRMPFCYAADLPEAIKEAQKRNICVYAAHLEGKTAYDEENYTSPCAFLVGNEGNGLRREIADMADVFIRIPMAGQVESLNAAIAASVLMFETARQRRKS